MIEKVAPKQKITAWHTHITDGQFESVTTVRENNEDIAYFVIKRTTASFFVFF